MRQTTPSRRTLAIWLCGLCMLPATVLAEEPKAPPSRVSVPIDEVLAAQPAEVQARYDARNPKETLAFFGVKPGMTVVEALPGGGWYSKILLPFLGEDGTLIGADYAMDMWPKFGFVDQAYLDDKKTWVADWTKQANDWRSEPSAKVSAFQFSAVPDDVKGQADAVLFVRALHNLARFENDGMFFSKALADTMTVLKPGGLVGVVQHRAPNSSSAEWASGAKGYLKQADVIEAFTKAGFEFVGSADFNRNPKDQPAEGDIVWRLPPSLSTSRDDPALRAKMQAIGESNRMTLKFRKPNK